MRFEVKLISFIAILVILSSLISEVTKYTTSKSKSRDNGYTKIKLESVDSDSLYLFSTYSIGNKMKIMIIENRNGGMSIINLK